MNYNDMFNMLGDRPNPFEDQMPMTPQQREFYQTPYQPTFQEQPRPLNWEEAFNGFKTHPVLYNMDGWISPYSSQNWGGTSNILQYIDDQQRIPNAENKIDPNRIFSAEVNGLRALSADQAKILKMFERKFAESLTEKGKVGLTEEDKSKAKNGQFLTELGEIIYNNDRYIFYGSGTKFSKHIELYAVLNSNELLSRIELFLMRTTVNNPNKEAE